MAEAESQAGSGTPFDGLFRLLDELGRGSRGVVFHALQQPLEEPVAIKVLHERLPEDSPSRDQFNDEVRAFAGLDQANLVSISSFGIAGEAPYIVMELLDGETVAARLGRGPIDPSEAETLIQTMLRAVAHLHLRGLVHRNLSPGSMFLHRKDDREQLKLIDYGLSRFAETTDTGRVALPSPYVSPEQAAGEDTDARTDVYAAGAIIMRLFGGEPPPSAANDNGSLRPAARVHPGASPQLDALVARALAPHRQERFGNADQMLKALLELPSPWITEFLDENEAIPVATNAPPMGETAEVAVAEPDAPAGARHNTPPPIPEAKPQSVPIVKMILAAVLGALIAGGGVALWVVRKDAAHEQAVAGKTEQKAEADKAADKHEAQPDHAKQPDAKAGAPAPAPAPAPDEKPKANEPLLKVEEETEEEEQEKTPDAKHEAHGEKAEAEKAAAKTMPAEQAKPGAEPPHAEPEHPAAHGGEPSAKASPPPLAAEKRGESEQALPKTAPEQHAEAEKPTPAEQHAEAERPTPAEQHAEAERPTPAERHAEAERPTPAERHAASEHTSAKPEQHAETEHAPTPPPEAPAAAEPPPPPPAPPIGAERHVKPLAFEIRAMLEMAQHPKKPRAKAQDPWEDASMPTALDSLRRSIDRGEPGKPNQISALRHYNAANPDDVHGHLLLAGLYKNRGWDADALDEYDMAYRIDSSSRGAPEMLPHALYMVAHDEAAEDATRFIVRAYQREALVPIDRAIRDSKDPTATARLKKLRARVQSGR